MKHAVRGGLRRAATTPMLLCAIGLLMLSQVQSTCIPSNLLPSDSTVNAGGPNSVTVNNQTGRELTDGELNEILATSDDGNIVVVFLNPNPGPQGPPGDPGALGPPGPAGPAGPQGLAASQPTTQPIVPPALVGEVRLWAGSYSSPPLGWAVCDGRELLETDFPELFAVIGERYGRGELPGTFRLPDLRDRNAIGASMEDPNGIPVTFVAGSPTPFGGEAQHQLTLSELPSHHHDMTHSHSIPSGPPGAGAIVVSTAGSSAPSTFPTDPSPTLTGPAGSDLPHNVLDPYLAISYIIFVGK